MHPRRVVTPRMKAKEVRDLDTTELQEKVASLKDELFRLRFQAATNNLDNPARIRQVKRDIARIKTVLREREIKARA